jgi:integrase
MASASITTRRTKVGGRRYAVRFRRGGRYFPIEHGGSFSTLREARIRRDLIAGELAAGRDPREAILTAVPSVVLTLDTWRERFLASRLDIDENTVKNYRTALKKVSESFGDRDPATITAAEVAEWVAGLAATYKPGTVQLYLIAFRLLLDFAGLEENPARDARVKLPKHEREEPQPPTGEQFAAILEAMGEKYRLLFITIEQGALRLGEAVGLRWGDVDFAGLRLRLARARTKSGKARFVYLPEWLLQAIDETCPMEDRTPERKVFQGISEASAYQAMLRACQSAGTGHFHPHDLRHRRITLWHQSGVPARELAERAGHSKPSMSLDVYSHVMPADEVPAGRFEALVTS